MTDRGAPLDLLVPVGHPGHAGAAVLTIAAAAIESARGPAAAGQIPLTRNEIAHLLAAVTAPPGRDAGHRLRWSHWRRRHQHRARTCHYQRQITQDHRIGRLNRAHRGWMAYFRLADSGTAFRDLDGRLRRRLRQVRWKE